jgi:hypothetical protein
MPAQDRPHRRRELLDLPGRLPADRPEDEHAALLPAPPALAVAAAGGLGDRSEPGLGADDAREVDVDAGFDQRSRDHPARRPSAKSVRIAASTSARCAAHIQVERWRTPPAPASALNTARAWPRELTMHSTWSGCRSIAASALSSSSPSSFSIRTRLRTLNSRSRWSGIGRTSRSPPLKLCPGSSSRSSMAGCVAVHSTIEVP